MIKVIIQYNGITLHFWEKFCLCASLKLMPSSKTKRPLKSHEWQILKRVFNIYEPLYLPRLNKDRPQHWDRHSIWRFMLFQSNSCNKNGTQLFWGLNSFSVHPSEWLEGTEGPEYPNTHKGTQTHSAALHGWCKGEGRARVRAICASVNSVHFNELWHELWMFGISWLG